MFYGLLKDIVDCAPRGKALLGLDVGKTTIGVALSDPAHSIAMPLQTIKRRKFTLDMQDLAAVAQEFEVGGFIVGLPLHMDGSEGKSAQSVRDFAREMLNYPDVVGKTPWVALWDERLSTATVEGFVDDMVDKRKTRVNSKSSGLIDKLAAQVILDAALQYMKKG